jgi:hypothetical protein
MAASFACARLPDGAAFQARWFHQHMAISPKVTSLELLQLICSLRNIGTGDSAKLARMQTFYGADAQRDAVTAALCNLHAAATNSFACDPAGCSCPRHPKPRYRLSHLFSYGEPQRQFNGALARSFYVLLVICAIV